MAIYALSDLHLAFGFPEKTMEVFGRNWDSYMSRIEENWNRVVSDEDLVLVPGDICWATKLNEAKIDFDHLNSLNGRKIISRGNHDYWWSTMNKIRAFLLENNYSTIDFIRNDDVVIEQDAIIAGTRGWNFPGINEFVESDRKIYERELIRLNICIESLRKADPEHKQKWIVTLHYPPLTKQHCKTGFTQILEEAKVDVCIYGHLHGLGHRSVFEGKLDSNPYTEFVCASSDYVGFNPVKIM
ncbi:MAG: metallophosphoesterase [Clostridia bacterium]|nr:metallophosphoesterase [Clostridia bacterium]